MCNSLTDIPTNVKIVKCMKQNADGHIKKPDHIEMIDALPKIIGRWIEFLVLKGKLFCHKGIFIKSIKLLFRL